ncbi:MAG: hypothetical protein JWL95_2976 [Gemmatimonadetes bacterium]|nr:hypothetical protein [Gemmatimonadota bacterium]
MPSRELVDPEGVVWEVFEVRRTQDVATPTLRSVSLGLEGGWLTFASVMGKRRLPHYPVGWAALQDHELWSLLYTARHVPHPISGLTGLFTARSNRAIAPQSTVGSNEPADETSATNSGATAAPNAIVESTVRAHARSARARGTPPVEALVQLKRILAESGHTTDALSLKRARGWFVESYYLERRQAPRD